MKPENRKEQNRTDHPFWMNSPKKRYWIIVVTAMFIFTILSGFSIHGNLQPYWIIFILLSISTGISLYLLNQTILWIISLKLKNKSSLRTKTVSPPNYLTKKIKNLLISFSFSVGFLIFWLMFLFFLQPHPDGTQKTLHLRDIIGGIVMNIGFSLVTYILVINFFTWITGSNFNPGKTSYNNLSSLNDFQENSFNSMTNKTHPTWEDWDRDPMNPASPEYQSTYKHWDHHD
jgi:hypothetical protein